MSKATHAGLCVKKYYRPSSFITTTIQSKLLLSFEKLLYNKEAVHFNLTATCLKASSFIIWFVILQKYILRLFVLYTKLESQT